jgi:membrane protein YdbS with pleckstrin-like domain
MRIGEMQMPTSLDPAKIDRPDPSLFHYYVYISLLSGPLFPVVLIPFWMRYATLRYKFDDQGVSMSWGVLFRRETNLTYRRIQDIHLTRNIFQRWMGLATISLQTASGNAQAEMTIEGVLQADELRDYLYARMRGAHDVFNGQSKVLHDDGAATIAGKQDAATHLATQTNVPGRPEVEVLQTLVEIRDAMKILVDRSRGEPS